MVRYLFPFWAFQEYFSKKIKRESYQSPDNMALTNQTTSVVRMRMRMYATVDAIS